MASSIAPDARGEAVPPAGHSGPGDGVLDCPVSQPACIAPVQTLLPGLEELCEGGQRGVLLLAGLLGSPEVQVVLTVRVLVRKYHTWVEESIRQPQDVLLHKVCELQSLTLQYFSYSTFSTAFLTATIVNSNRMKKYCKE